MNDFANTTQETGRKKIDTESAILAHIMNELKHTKGFLDTILMLSDMLHNQMDIS